MVYKFLSGIYDCNIACQCVRPTHIVSRGHHLRLFYKRVRYDLCKYYFGNRFVSFWNICLILSFRLTHLVYLRVDRIIFGVIKHVILIIKPT